ncbi:MAG: sigma-70 family RNA polymerase sigma factor [Acidobacteriota bacterium]
MRSRPTLVRSSAESLSAPQRVPHPETPTPTTMSSGGDLDSLHSLDPERRLRAFERVFLPHFAAALNLARWLTKSPATADDLVQTAYLKALRSCADFRGENPRDWLLAIVRNAFYSEWRLQRGRERELSLDDLDDSPGEIAASQARATEPDPERLLLLANASHLMRVGLDNLPAQLREVLVLREMEGLSYKSIAAVTEVPIGTVMSRLARARQRLQEFLVERGLQGGVP